MIKRKAIIIGSPGGYRGLKKLKGVAIDLENYYTFLTSNAGGQWLKDEIIVLHDPNTKTLTNIIADTNTDYSFIAFSGHGLAKSFTKSDYICLKDNNYSLNCLVSKSPRQTIIIDINREHITNIKETTPLLFTKDSETHSFTEQNTRSIFDNGIEITPKGIILVYSTQPDGIGGEDNRRGGHFTYSLIKVGFNWWSDKENIGVLKLEKAVDEAEIAMKNIFLSDQKPTMGGQIRRLTFPPFACSLMNN